jgi:magnesium-transporting ATPase (P-type)
VSAKAMVNNVNFFIVLFIFILLTMGLVHQFFLVSSLATLTSLFHEWGFSCFLLSFLVVAPPCAG